MRTRLLAVGLALVTGLTACAAEDEADVADQPIDSVPEQPAAPLAEGQMLDPNSATREQLLALPQLDEARADAIIAGRPYADMLAVDRVLAGLSEADRDSVYTRLWKPIDLNNASAEEILLIPGIGDRMLREFREYRPYTDIGQFRREMGKYVDDEEVARMEKYVEVRG